MAFGHGPLASKYQRFGAAAAPPVAPTITAPVASTAYSGTLGLSSTATDVDGNTWHADYEYSSTGVAPWTAIASGSTVASGGASAYSWDISLLAPMFTYKVRARSVDSKLRSVGWVESSAFIIGPGFASIFADANTTFYAPTSTTTKYGADTQTTFYEAVKS